MSMVRSQIISPQTTNPQEPAISDSSKQEQWMNLTLILCYTSIAQEGLLWGPNDKVSHENISFSFSPLGDNTAQGISCRQRLNDIFNSPWLCAPIKVMQNKTNNNNSNILTLPAPKLRVHMDTYSYNAVPREVTSTCWYIYVLGNPEQSPLLHKQPNPDSLSVFSIELCYHIPRLCSDSSPHHLWLYVPFLGTPLFCSLTVPYERCTTHTPCSFSSSACIS